MNKDQVLDRIEKIKMDRLHHEKMQILLDGALQDCEFWLKQCAEELKHQENDNGQA